MFSNLQSSALVVGWYTSQLFHLKYKYNKNKHYKSCLAIQNLISTLHPYVNHVDKDAACLNSATNVGNIIETFAPTVYLISNDQKGTSKERTTSTSTDTNTNPDSSDGDLGEVLNSIENRLGLAAIEKGQHQDGLNLLRYFFLYTNTP